MKLFALFFALLAFSTNQAIVLAEAEPGPVPESMPEANPKAAVLEPRDCAKIRVCHDFDFKGGCYSECKRPGVLHPIEDAWKKNVGSFAVDSSGYICYIYTVTMSGMGTCSGEGKPGFKRLPSYCVNDINQYQCDFYG